MCGIAGVVGDVGDVEPVRRMVQAMAATLAHRGPDEAGDLVDGAMAFAQRRLAVIDLSPAGRQPMTSASGRWTVVFNGEIYNHAVLREMLAPQRFRGRSDTESLVEAIDRWGVEGALRRSNGMFAVAAWDRQLQELTLARDRMGEKPLYWSVVGSRLAFASELRGFRAIGWPLSIDDGAARAVLRWGFVPHPSTIYAEVRQVPPGGLITAAIGGDAPRVRAGRWWSLPDVAAASATSDVAQRRGRSSAERRKAAVAAAAERVESLLADAVAMRLASDVPLGAFLSGGIDSALVAAFAQEAMGERRLTTFTVSMPDLGDDEAPAAAATARHLGTDHHVVAITTGEALAAVPTLVDTWDEPLADPSMLPTALLCTHAGEDLTVCLGGDGGDELFAGYNRHAFGVGAGRWARRLPSPLRAAAGSALTSIPRGPLNGAAGASRHVLPARWHLPDLGDKVHKAGRVLRAGGDVWPVLAGVWPDTALGGAVHPPEVGAVDGLDPLDRMLLADQLAVLPDGLLVKADRASMAASLEVRAPLLDHRLVELSWSLPHDALAGRGTGKLVLRHLARSRLPSGAATRPKQGFDPPLASWLRNELRPWAGDLLANPTVVESGWIDGVALDRAWREHCAGTRNWDYRLWAVLMLESWCARYRSPSMQRSGQSSWSSMPPGVAGTAG